MKNLDKIKENLEKAKDLLIKDAANPALAPKDRKVKELQQKIDAGKYKPDAGKIAGKMVEQGMFNKNGQWKIEKSNYGPKGMKLYNPTDNIKRKQTRTSDVVETVGQNKAVRQYTTSGSSTDKARMSAELKRQKAANKKAPVRTLKDMSPQEQAELRAKYETKKTDMEKFGYGSHGSGAGAGIAMSDDAE